MTNSAEQTMAAALSLGATLATAESVTGGLVAAALSSVPGASEVLLGGVVAYTSDVKVSVLGVERSLIDVHGVVSEEVALAMAHGVRRVLGADVAVATTGVAGPTAHGRAPVGRVCFAATSGTHAISRTLELSGSRVEVRAQATEAALVALCDVLHVHAAAGTPVR